MKFSAGRYSSEMKYNVAFILGHIAFNKDPRTLSREQYDVIYKFIAEFQPKLVMTTKMFTDLFDGDKNELYRRLKADVVDFVNKNFKDLL